MSEPEIVIGRIVAPFGLKGEVKVQLETDYPETLLEAVSVWLKNQTEAVREVGIESVRFHKKQALIKFEGVDTIDQAEALRGQELRKSESELKELNEDEYYLHQLIGLQVLTETGKALGPITEVIRSSANDVYVTEKALIPALKDIVIKIDLEAGEMVVRPIPGMLEEEL